MNRVLVVSAFGRSHWLAVALAKQGIPTTLLDVTEKLGSWVPEEVEGPFGLFQEERLPSALSEILHESFLEADSQLQVKNGFTIWLKSGPVEFKGPVTSWRLNQLNVPENVQNYLLKPSLEQKKKIEKLEFSQNWPAQIGHNFMTNTYAANAESFSVSDCVPLFSSYSIRLPTRVGHQRNLKWCQSQQVQVIEKALVKDISLAGRNQVKGLEYQQEGSEKTQVIDCEQMIWSLSSEETKVLGEGLESRLYPRGVLEPEWSWTRYRLKITEGLMRDELPMHVLVVEDLGQPWTHANWIVLVRTGSADFFDAWVRLPTIQRFNKSYLVERGRELVSVLSERLTRLKFEVASYPLGYEFTFGEIGPSRQPIYDARTKASWKASRFQNVWLDSCEQTEGLGLRHQVQHQAGIYSGLVTWWEKVLAKRKTQTNGVEKSD